MTLAATQSTSLSARQRQYNTLLLLVAGLGGLLYGVDVGIIGGALPYLEATSGLNAGQLSVIVAAVLLGSVISTLFAGLLAGLARTQASDDHQRQHLRHQHPDDRLVLRLRIAVFRAPAAGYERRTHRRRGAALSCGVSPFVEPRQRHRRLPVAAHARHRRRRADRHLLQLSCPGGGAGLGRRCALPLKDQAWRRIFWVSLHPASFSCLAPCLWRSRRVGLFRRGHMERALAALLRSHAPQTAQAELDKMEQLAAPRRATGTSKATVRDSIFRRRYVIPFLLACVILFCNTATGVNSIISYNTGILLQSGLSDLSAHWGYVLFTVVNFPHHGDRYGAGRPQRPPLSSHPWHHRRHRISGHGGRSCSCERKNRIWNAAPRYRPWSAHGRTSP